jgi:hypothetical protein
VSSTDWMDWHRPYDDPDSPLSQRLVAVQAAILAWLGCAPPGPLRVVSVCAGQGHDLIGALAEHPRRSEVTARLVELDPRNCARAADAARAAGLAGVEVVTADASATSAYDGAVPADLVLVCGVFGNISAADIRATIGHVRSFCAPGAQVIWTRHRRPPDLTGSIREWFVEEGFDEVSFAAPEAFVFGVGTARLRLAPAPFVAGVTMFDFVGDGWRPA